MKTLQCLILIVLVVAFAAVGEAAAQPAAFKSTKLYEMPFHPKNGPMELASPVAHAHGVTYVVMPNSQCVPYVAQVPDTPSASLPIASVPLDPNPDYRAMADPHNTFSIGIDRDGYLHITGDMHQYGGSDGRTYPERYQKKRMLYWRSRKPRDVTAGFEFLGGDSARTMPGESWTYGRFFNSPDGELYYSSRVRAFWASKYGPGYPNAKRGAMALGLYKYDTATRTWSAIGGPVDKPASEVAKYLKVFFWADAGRQDTGGGYQVFQSHFSFDRTGRLHFAGSAWVDLEGNARVIYARSDDGGKTWQKADGTPIPGLPIRAEDGVPNAGDCVMRGKHTGITRVVADRNGRPAVLHGVTADQWHGWDGKAWKKLDGSQMYGVAAGMSEDGRIVLWSGYSLGVTDSITGPLLGTRGKGGIFCPSELGLITTGRLYGVLRGDAEKVVRVVRIDLPPMPKH